MTKALFVGGFQQSRTELTMNFDGRADDGSSSGVLLAFRFLDVLKGTQSSHSKTVLPQSHRGTENTCVSNS